MSYILISHLVFLNVSITSTVTQELQLSPKSTKKIFHLAKIYSGHKLFPSKPEIQPYEIERLKVLSDKGGFGDCYKGLFLGNHEVAMKCLRLQTHSTVAFDTRMKKVLHPGGYFARWTLY